jgi:hypothetical protein
MPGNTTRYPIAAIITQKQQEALSDTHEETLLPVAPRSRAVHNT